MFWRGLRSFCNISCRSFNFVKAEKIYDTNLNYSNPCFFAISMSMFSKLFFDASETARADEKHTCCVWRSCILIHAFFFRSRLDACAKNSVFYFSVFDITTSFKIAQNTLFFFFWRHRDVDMFWFFFLIVWLLSNKWLVRRTLNDC